MGSLYCAREVYIVWMSMVQTRQAQAGRVDVMGYISWARRAAQLAAARPQRRVSLCRSVALQ